MHAVHSFVIQRIKQVCCIVYVNKNTLVLMNTLNTNFDSLLYSHWILICIQQHFSIFHITRMGKKKKKTLESIFIEGFSNTYNTLLALSKTIIISNRRKYKRKEKIIRIVWKSSNLCTDAAIQRMDEVTDSPLKSTHGVGHTHHTTTPPSTSSSSTPETLDSEIEPARFASSSQSFTAGMGLVIWTLSQSVNTAQD